MRLGVYSLASSSSVREWCRYHFQWPPQVYSYGYRCGRASSFLDSDDASGVGEDRLQYTVFGVQITAINKARPIVVAIAPAMDTSRVKATSVPITAQIMPMMILLVSMAFTESVHK